jgi:signal recognition particle GTPase
MFTDNDTGKGLIILLHGAPGVGKTTTAGKPIIYWYKRTLYGYKPIIHWYIAFKLQPYANIAAL